MACYYIVMPKPYRASSRTFLNKPGFHSDASATWDFHVSDRCYAECQIRIRDCDETINLSLEVHTAEWLANSQYKLDVFISLLQAAKKELPKAAKALDRANKAK